MGTLADSLFTVLMSWVRGLVNGLWALFSAENTTMLEFLGKNWLMIAVVIVAAGLVIDWIIWLLRWQPYHLWAQRVRRMLHIEEPEEEEKPQRARAAQMPKRRIAYEEEPEGRMEEDAGLRPFVLDAQQEQEVFEHATSVPDEYAYPGMRYDSEAKEALDGTQRYGAVTQEGPGAAEVARRKAEIDAWQLQMQQEARERAQAEQARLAREAYEAEQARLAREAYEAEQARLAQEAYEAEQARLAQEQYERELAQYEREKAEYERELAQYEQKKAEYEAYLAREAAAKAQEQADELTPDEDAQPHARRRRSAAKQPMRYSDYVQGEAVEQLPDAPQWPDMQQAHEDAPHKRSKLIDKMAKMIEPEEEQLAARTKLPPRVNMQDAYKPAVAPRKPGRRGRNA